MIGFSWAELVILLAVIAIGVILLVVRGLNRIQLGHATLDCPHCKKVTTIASGKCQHCSKELS